MGFGFYFNGFQIIVTLMTVLVIGIFAVTILRGIAEWNKNNQSPCVTVFAVVSGKRAHTSHHVNHHASTTYHVTFEFERGDRVEFRVSEREYAMLAEGDTGELTFQGTRYLEFERF